MMFKLFHTKFLSLYNNHRTAYTRLSNTDIYSTVYIHYVNMLSLNTYQQVQSTHETIANIITDSKDIKALYTVTSPAVLYVHGLIQVLLL